MLRIRPPPGSTPFPYTTLFRSEQQNSDAAKTDVAPLDNPKADANDQTVNYKIAIRLDEAYPDLRMDQLSNKQKLLEYERSSYEVRVDEVPMFPNAQE